MDQVVLLCVDGSEASIGAAATGLERLAPRADDRGDGRRRGRPDAGHRRQRHGRRRHDARRDR